MDLSDKPLRRVTRGANYNPDNRFHERHKTSADRHFDYWQNELEQAQLNPTCTYSSVSHRQLIQFNQSPDVPFDRSINPYHGCEHGCIYCFARPSHAYWDLSPGLDFETQILYKTDLRESLLAQLAKPGYQVAPIAIGMNTDAYQPIEKQTQSTRVLIQTLLELRHPFTLLTKSALIERDLELLTEAAQLGLTSVGVSLTSLDVNLTRRMEPRAAAPKRRLKTIETLSARGISVNVLVAPVIPFINDSELERIIAAVRDAGARSAGYVFLRLPHELTGLFETWLRLHFPQRAERVLKAIRTSRGGKLYQADFHKRQSGEGVFAALIAKRFAKASQRHGLDRPMPPLRTDLFKAPVLPGTQLNLPIE